MNSRLNSWSAWLLTVAISSAAGAQSEATSAAQALFDEAKALVANDRSAQACPKFEESQRIEPSAGTLLNLADCYERTQRLASAWARYIDAAAASATTNPEREQVARERAAALAPRLSRVVIMVAPASRTLPGLEIRRDGALVGQPAWDTALPIDAGQHRITATALGRRAFESTVTITIEGQTTTISVPELSALPLASSTPPPSHQAGRAGLGPARTTAVIAGGVGIVGMSLGAAYGLISISKHDEAAKYCEGSACTDQRGVDAGDAARSAGTISTVAMIVGALGLATGATLWLTAPKTSGETGKAKLGLGVGSVRLEGAF